MALLAGPVRFELLDDFGAQCLERPELAQRLRKIIAQLGEDLLLDLHERDLTRARFAAQRFSSVVVGEPEADLTPLAGPHAGDRLIDFGHDGAVADHELIARLPNRLLTLHRQHVIHDGEVAGSGRALDVAELGLLLTHPVERGVYLGARHRHRGVLDLDALHVPERDVGLDLDDGGEGQRGALLESYILEIRLADGIEPHLGQRLTIDVGNEVLRDLTADIVGEVNLHQRARDVTFAEAGQARLLLDTIVRALPFLGHDIGRRFDDETPLTALHLLDGDLHRSLQAGALDPTFWWPIRHSLSQPLPSLRHGGYRRRDPRPRRRHQCFNPREPTYDAAGLPS